MEDAEKIAFKNRLKECCIQSMEERIAGVKASIKNAQEAANSEEKSSAGDKYETGRAMGHLQKDMHARQLAEYLKEKAILLSVNAASIYYQAVAGAFVETEQVSFFIAAGLGKQTINGQSIFFISPYAPLAIMLQNKTKGDLFLFNKTGLVITDLF